jgi:predicted Fe-Mo cluster-binding NifX family protein
MEKETTKIAVPLFGERIAPRFDTALKVLFITIEDGKIAEEEEITLVGVHPLRMSHWFKEEGVDIVICAAIDVMCSRTIVENDIQLFCRIVGPAREAVSAYLNGNLNSMAMGNCPFGRVRRFRGGFDDQKIKKS